MQICLSEFWTPGCIFYRKINSNNFATSNYQQIKSILKFDPENLIGVSLKFYAYMYKILPLNYLLEKTLEM